MAKKKDNDEGAKVLEFPPRDGPKKAADPGTVEPYGFTEEWERVVAVTAATSPNFWRRLEGTLQVDGFRLEAARLILQAVAAIAHDNQGTGPSSVATVLQRLRGWQDDGKLTAAELKGARAMVVETLDGTPMPPEPEVLGELVPVLRRRLQAAALDEGYKDLVGRGDMTRVEEMLGKARRLGQARVSGGARIDPSGFEMIRRMSALKRLPTDIRDLDEELKGGIREGEYWLYAGGFGSGKSMGLNQTFTRALIEGVCSALASLELSVDLQYARSVSNLTNIPIDDLLDDMMNEGQGRLEQLCEKGRIAHGTIEYFTPGKTTVGDLKAWIKDEEQLIGAPIELLVVDYADKLWAGDLKVDKPDKEIAEGLRGLMDRNLNPDLHLRWVVSATQIKGAAHDRKKTKKVEGHHAADSIDKPRVCDGMVTFNPRDDGQSILYHVTKNRTGVAGGDVGPIPIDWPCGRNSPVERPHWPY